MLVKYYKNENLSYSSRKRYRKIDSFVSFNEEEQLSILLGDGANTSIKTSVSNICDYVTIDDTRWFVTSYNYLNGGQVKLNLQRDVIGENGIAKCFGKIERGYTDNFLKYRKELNLNQILKERKYLQPNTMTYGNFSVDNHNNELWGILYLTNTEKITINIPEFSPKTVNYSYIENNTKYAKSYSQNCVLSFYVSTSNLAATTVVYKTKITIKGNSWTVDVNEVSKSYFGDAIIQINTTKFNDNSVNVNSALRIEAVKAASNLVVNAIFRNSGDSSFVFETPKTFPPLVTISQDYNGVVIKKGDKYYIYSVNIKNEKNDYHIGNNSELNDFIYNETNNHTIYINNGQISINLNYAKQTVPFFLEKVSNLSVDYIIYNNEILTGESAGNLDIESQKQLIDEPYTIIVMPLFDCNLSGVKTNNDGTTSNVSYKISRSTAFMVFNTIIQKLSGENPFLVDAQIYPYCPVLTNVASEINKYPLFYIQSNNYTHYCYTQLRPYTNVKKEYIQRQYSIVSPEQSNKFNFNFYDYVNYFEDNNGINYAKMLILIKTALKPFAIFSSAVIQPNGDNLNGITYSSDMRGAQPTSNGFECSIASNAFETYKRQNSNFQQIFALEQNELQKQHQVERVNDIVSTITNTATATAMGMIAGASAADVGVFKAGPAGAAIGGAVAGGGVGAAMTAQAIVNEKLRQYEEDLQQQRFNLTIGTIKNLPNTINRISSFNEIILRDFWYVIEIYECSEEEGKIVNNFIEKYGYGIGVFDFMVNYSKNGWFLRGNLISSDFIVNLHMIAEKELKGGIYIYE